MLDQNTIAPDFLLPDQDGVNHKLSEYRGQWVLLYFYPADDTPGCTTEACSFRDNLPNFEKLQLKVFGISADSVESHKNFAKKYGLNFVLLSDINKEVIERYEAVGALGTKRISYLINPEGEIARTYDKVNPKSHAEEVSDNLNIFK